MLELLKEVEKYEDNYKQTPVPVSEALLKSILPTYRFVELIGIGGEGILIKSLDSTGKSVAVKIARSSYQGKYSQTPGKASIVNSFSFRGKPKSTNTNYERFLEGATLQRDLSQQLVDDQITAIQIPSVLTISTDPLFFTMPCLENTGILRYFKDFNKKLKEILSVFINLLRGVDYLHSHGIIHRDYKSDNLMIHKNLKSVVILDWSLAKPVGNRGVTVSGTIGGTPGLASDKFMDGNFRDANFKDDIYALGFVMWEFVTGRRIADYYVHGSKKLKREEQEDFKRKIIKYLPEILHTPFWKSTDFVEKDRYTNITEFQRDIVKIFQDFDLNQVTILKESEEKEVNEIMDVIFDTDCVKDMCKTCKNPRVCKDFGLCNLLYSLLK